MNITRVSTIWTLMWFRLYYFKRIVWKYYIAGLTLKDITLVLASVQWKQVLHWCMPKQIMTVKSYSCVWMFCLVSILRVLWKMLMRWMLACLPGSIIVWLLYHFCDKCQYHVVNKSSYCIYCIKFWYGFFMSVVQMMFIR